MPIPNLSDHLHKISRQSSVFLLGTLFTAAIGYLFKIYLARALGAEALGIYALGMTVGGLASIVGSIGIPENSELLCGRVCQQRGKREAEPAALAPGWQFFLSRISAPASR